MPQRFIIKIQEYFSRFGCPRSAVEIFSWFYGFRLRGFHTKPKSSSFASRSCVMFDFSPSQNRRYWRRWHFTQIDWSTLGSWLWISVAYVTIQFYFFSYANNSLLPIRFSKSTFPWKVGSDDIRPTWVCRKKYNWWRENEKLQINSHSPEGTPCCQVTVWYGPGNFLLLTNVEVLETTESSFDCCTLANIVL